MHTRPVLTATPVAVTVAGAVLAFVVALGLFGALAGLFLHDGRPLEALVVAERACSESAYVSEREACIRSFVALSHRPRVASR
jgi:hypothetical protein